MNDPQSPNNPPMAPDHLDHTTLEASKWPGVIGGISIAFGALAMLGACCGSAGIFSMRFASGATGIAFPSLPIEMIVWIVVDGALTLVLAWLLVWGGINTLRRRASGPRFLRFYAVARLLLAIPLVMAGLWLLKPQAAWQAGMVRATNEWKEKQKVPVTETDREGERPKEVGALEVAPVVAMSFIGVIYPAVLLVMLSKRAKRDEIQRWQS